MADDDLIRMANQIAQNFLYEDDEQKAAAFVAQHIRLYWTPLMRAELIALEQEGGTGLSEAAERAVRTLATLA